MAESSRSGPEKEPSSRKVDVQTVVSSEQKNAVDVLCQRCGSKIFVAHAARLVNDSISLPQMYLKGSSVPVETELYTEFWCLPDMFAFENVGFSHTVGDIKYLTCADCEIGPIGLHRPTQSKDCFVCCHRVTYKT